MHVTVNDTRHEFRDGTTVADLLRALGLESYEGVGVEMSGAFVDRADYARTIVPDGAVLEVVRFVGGG